jgi:hypothetical protein
MSVVMIHALASRCLGAVESTKAVRDCWCVFGIKRSQQENVVVSYYR